MEGRWLRQRSDGVSPFLCILLISSNQPTPISTDKFTLDAWYNISQYIQKISSTAPPPLDIVFSSTCFIKQLTRYEQLSRVFGHCACWPNRYPFFLRELQEKRIITYSYLFVNKINLFFKYMYWLFGSILYFILYSCIIQLGSFNGIWPYLWLIHNSLVLIIPLMIISLERSSILPLQKSKTQWALFIDQNEWLNANRGSIHFVTVCGLTIKYGNIHSLWGHY